MLALALALLAAMALKGALLILPSPPADANATGLRRQPRGGAAGAHPRRPAAASGRQRRRRRGARAADRRDARASASIRASPTISPATASRRSRTVACARVRNLVATIGPAEGRHLLLVSHYDSAPSPGRARPTTASASPRCWRSPHLLRGQRLAPAGHLPVQRRRGDGPARRPRLPRARSARRRGSTPLINLEARGVTGPAIMFETSRPNGAAIALYRAAAPRPVANSLSTDLYRPDPQFDRRRRVRGAALDDPQLRGDRQRDALSQRRRRSRRARPAQPPAYGRARRWR